MMKNTEKNGIADFLLHFIAPESCPVCGRVGKVYCDSCLESCVEPLQTFCSACGGSLNEDVCKGSIACRAACFHRGDARTFLLKLKYKGARTIGIPMGRTIAKSFARPDADLIVPVPLHTNSDRGFNQTTLLARGMSEIWGIPCAETLSWRFDIGRQVEKAGSERAAMPHDAIACEPLNGARVVVADDVFTTGSTLRAASGAIEKSGGSVVSAYFWTRSARVRDIGQWEDVEDAILLKLI